MISETMMIFYYQLAEQMVFIHVDSLQSLGPTMATGDSKHLGRVCFRLGNSHAPTHCHFHRDYDDEPVDSQV